MITIFKKFQYVFLLILASTAFSVSAMDNNKPISVLSDILQNYDYHATKQSEQSAADWMSNIEANKKSLAESTTLQDHLTERLEKLTAKERQQLQQQLPSELASLEKRKKESEESAQWYRALRINLNANAMTAGIIAAGYFLAKTVLPATAASIRYIIGNKELASQMLANSRRSLPTALMLAGIAVGIDQVQKQFLKLKYYERKNFIDAANIVKKTAEETLASEEKKQH